MYLMGQTPWSQKLPRRELGSFQVTILWGSIILIGSKGEMNSKSGQTQTWHLTHSYVSPACISQVIGKRGLSLTFSQKHSLTFSLTFLRWWEGGWKARAVSHLQPRPPAPALWLWCQVMLNTDTDTDTEHSGYGARWFLNTDLEADIYQHDNSGTVVTEMLPVITLSLWGELSVRPWAGDNSITKTLSRG